MSPASAGAFARLREEPKLAATFGEQYERYRANVPRWDPRLQPSGPEAAITRA
jgi:protein-S-isoprenylcysteine O-methyltransferase Ste14